MSEQEIGWTQSQKLAFPYTQRGAAEGLTATEALRQYREGGGAIRDSLWFSLYRDSFAQVGVRDKVTHIPMTYTVPDTMFQSVDYDYRSEYVMQMKVTGYSPELEKTVTRWTSVESDALVTKQEWLYGAQQSIDETLGSAPLLISSVIEWNPLKRSGKLEW